MVLVAADPAVVLRLSRGIASTPGVWFQPRLREPFPISFNSFKNFLELYYAMSQSVKKVKGSQNSVEFDPFGLLGV